MEGWVGIRSGLERCGKSRSTGIELLPIDVSVQVQRPPTGLSAIKTDFPWSILILTSFSAPNMIDAHRIYNAGMFHTEVIIHSVCYKA
jgi:hypothetical protein